MRASIVRAGLLTLAGLLAGGVSARQPVPGAPGGPPQPGPVPGPPAGPGAGKPAVVPEAEAAVLRQAEAWIRKNNRFDPDHRLVTDVVGDLNDRAVPGMAFTVTLGGGSSPASSRWCWPGGAGSSSPWGWPGLPPTP